jgi:hypothetical protein
MMTTARLRTFAFQAGDSRAVIAERLQRVLPDRPCVITYVCDKRHGCVAGRSAP